MYCNPNSNGQILPHAFCLVIITLPIFSKNKFEVLVLYFYSVNLYIRLFNSSTSTTSPAAGERK